MNGPKQRPSNMNQMCRLCLAEDEITSPIFGEEDSSSESQIPLSFRIMACVSVEVSLSDGLPKVICEKCLTHVNSWHEFKQICDLSQAKLKEWQHIGKENCVGDKDIVIKQEPVDPEPEEDVLEIIDDADSSQILVEDIKQEVDMYDEDGHDSVSVEAVDAEVIDPFDTPIAFSSNTLKNTENTEVEIVAQAAGDVSHLQITDIKTECGDVQAEPSEGRLLRSVLQGNTRLRMYSKEVLSADDDSIKFQAVKPFLCRLCDKSFAYNYLLKRHEKTHKGDRNVCGFCQKGFSSHASLVQHVRFFSGTISMPYTCDHCQQEFSCRTQYLSHTDGSDGSGCEVVLTTNDEVPDGGDVHEIDGECEICSESFPSQMLLRLHMRKEHFQYSCHKCDKSYTNGVALSNHLRSHTIGAVRHHCESCPRTFPTFDLLKKHERTHTKANAVMAVIPKASECPDTETPASVDEICLDKEIKKEPDSPEIVQDEENQHLKNETSQLSHVCHLCNEKFPTIASLRFHLKGVHLHYQCHRCPKVYSSGVALSNHLRSHSLSSFKKHKCLVCLKTFATIDKLSKHKKIHTAPASIPSTVSKVEKPIVPKNDCDYLTANVMNFDGSIDEPLMKRTCKVCNFVAASPSALERHMACHTRAKHYMCTICHVSMSYASSLQKHYRLIHNRHIELRAIQKNVVQVDNGTSEKTNEQDPDESFTKAVGGVIFNKTFKMTAQLQQAELPTPYECKVCHRSFAYRSFLLKHSKMHNHSMSSVACQICFKMFPDSKTLNNHKGVHTRFKHFSCNICGKSFNGLNAWQKHERMHQKGFIYSCKLCGKKFISKAELHEHKKMHIKVKIYTCAVCKNSYHSSSALGKHKRRHGHWYPSAENSEASEVEIINDSDSTPIAPVMKPAICKSLIMKQSVHKSIIRSSITLSRLTTHFPSGKRRPSCLICHKVFSHMNALRKHKRVHEVNFPVTPQQDSAEGEVAENVCFTCNRAFPDHVSLVRHKGWHTRRSTPFTDPVATPAVVATSPETSPVNQRTLKSETSVANFPCTVCTKTFTSSSALESHIKIHSDTTSRAPTAEKSKVSADLDENDVLTFPRRLACKICKKPFESKKALITHIGWHSRDSHINNPSFSSYRHKSVPKLNTGDKFSCNVCHKIFSSAVILSKHKKLHTRKLLSSIKDKSGILESNHPGSEFPCMVCHKVFKLEKYLMLHMRLHTGEKRFKCNLCPQAYHRSGSLWKHKRTHHGMKVFSCPICQKRFGLKVQLTKHVETHQSSVDFVGSDTVFACSRCDKTFPTLTKFKQHEKSHHG